MMSGFDKFYMYLSELNQNYEKLQLLLQEKLEAVENFETDRLDAIIREEQVYVMIAKGFDANIKSYREALGLKGHTLSAIIRELPHEEYQRFQDLFRLLATTLAIVKRLNEQCQALISERLYSLDKTVRELDKASTKPYGKARLAKQGASEPHFLTKSV